MAAVASLVRQGGIGSAAFGARPAGISETRVQWLPLDIRANRRGLFSLPMKLVDCTSNKCSCAEVPLKHKNRQRLERQLHSAVFKKGEGKRQNQTMRQAAMASEGPLGDSQTSGNGADENSSSSSKDVTVGLAEQFCIIEGAETMQDFARMQLKEIKENISSRRNKIFLLMEEVRRLRIQQRLKSAEQSLQEDSEDETSYPSSIPFLPPLTKTDLRQKYYVTFFSLIGAVIVFGGFFAPVLELKLGIGGTSYADFIRSLNLPIQLSQVDPIVASFSGGAVGVLSSLMIVELNNVSLQEEKKCHYCKGSGYLACAKCGGMGAIMDPAEREQLKEQLISAGKPTAASLQVALKKLRGERCNNCSGAGKVMCPTCLCTGMALATEHDPRIDPFD